MTLEHRLNKLYGSTAGPVTPKQVIDITNHYIRRVEGAFPEALEEYLPTTHDLAEKEDITKAEFGLTWD